MTKDFKIQPENTSGLSPQGMGWMLGGIAAGLLAGLALYNLSNNSNADSIPAPPATTETTSPPPAATADSSMADKPETGKTTLKDMPETEEQLSGDPIFSYHAVLPQMEVALPTSVQEAASKAERKQKTASGSDTKKTASSTEAKTSPTTPVKISKANGFQLGAYKNESQAAKFRSRLSSKGLNTRIEKTEVNGQTIYRVRIGPAADQKMLDKWQQTLSGMGISPMAVRM